MALIKFGLGVTGMSGSVGGVTAARNRSGSYFRARTKPINPNSARQQVIRAAMATLTTRWAQTLTAAQRTAWNLYAASVTSLNKLGETINLSGFNQFIRSNMPRQQCSLTIIDAGPTTFELPEQDPTLSVTGSEATQELSFAFDDTMDWLDEDNASLILYQGSPQNAQRNFFAGPWRLLDSVEGDSNTAPTTPQAIAAPFAITELQRDWAYGRISRADGRLSDPFRCNCFIGA